MDRSMCFQLSFVWCQDLHSLFWYFEDLFLHRRIEILELNPLLKNLYSSFRTWCFLFLTIRPEVGLFLKNDQFCIKDNEG